MSKIKTSMIAVASAIVTLLLISIIFIGLLASGELVLDKRPLEITISEAVKEYDGNPIDAKFFITKGNLIDGDSVKITFSDDTKEAGTHNLNPNVSIVDNSGNEHTNKYEITIKGSTGEVKKRKIEIGPKNGSINYGDKITADSFTITSGTLLPFHRLVPTYEEVPGENGNRIKLTTKIIDANAKDVTKNYNVSSELYFDYDKRPLIIKTKDAKKVFDGEPLTQEIFIAEGLAEGDTADVETSTLTKLENVGSITNDYKDTKFIIKNKNNEDVTDNYFFIIQPLGVLTIEPRIVDINILDYETEYTGQAVEIHAEYDIDAADDEIFKKLKYNLKFTPSDNELINAGSYKNNVNVKLIDKNEEEVENIKLNIIRGDIIVKPKVLKNINIEEGLEIPYSGKAKYELNPDIFNGSAPILPNKLILKNNIIDIPTEISDAFIEVPILPSAFMIIDQNGHDVSKNYEFEKSVMIRVKIIKRKVSITPISLEPITFDSIEMINEYLKTITGYSSKSNFIGNEDIKLSYEASKIVEKDKQFKINLNAKINDVNGKDISNNYDISYNVDSNGKSQPFYLDFKEKEINAHFNKHADTYNGLEKSFKPNLKDVISEADRLYLERVGVKLMLESFKATNAGKYETIYNANLIGINQQFIKLNITSDGVEIYPKKINIYEEDFKYEYDGTAKIINAINDSFIELGVKNSLEVVDGDTIWGLYDKVDSKNNYCINVGFYDVPLLKFKVVDINGIEVTKNYEAIKTESAKIEINKKVINGCSNDINIDFTGTQIDLNNSWYTIFKPERFVFDLVPDVTFEGVLNGKNLGVKSYKVYLDGKDVTNNIDFKFNASGIASFKKINITIVPRDYRTTFNGKPISFQGDNATAHMDYDIIGNSYITKDNVQVKFNHAPILNAGTYDVKLTMSKALYDGFNVTKLIKVNMATGTCIVDKATLSISTPSISWVYGENVPQEKIKDYTLSIEDAKVEIIQGSLPEKIEAGSYTNKVLVNSDNYNIIYNYGTLTVLPRKITILAPSYTITQGGSVVLDKSWINCGINGEAIGSVTYLSAEEISSLGVGTHYYIKKIEVSKNYEINIIGGTITVTA